MAALLQELVDAPEPKSCGWIRAIDEAMVTHHLGVADIADDYEAAKKKLNTLLCLNQDIGEYFSAKAPTPSVPDGDLSEARRIVEQQRGEIERLRNDLSGAAECIANQSQTIARQMDELARLKADLALMRDTYGIDDRYAGRLAIMLECTLLDHTGTFNEACRLLDEYRAEWDRVNPQPSLFMGEPVPERRARLQELKECRQ